MDQMWIAKMLSIKLWIDGTSYKAEDGMMEKLPTCYQISKTQSYLNPFKNWWLEWD